MARVAAHVDLAVPADLIQQAVQGSLGDERLGAAYRMLRPGKEYSGWVTSVVPGRRLEIAFAALEPGSGKRKHRMGWRVIYEFTSLSDGRTRAETSIEYGAIAALGAAGTLRAQAENDIAQRLAALYALETGFLAGRST